MPAARLLAWLRGRPVSLLLLSLMLFYSASFWVGADALHQLVQPIRLTTAALLLPVSCEFVFVCLRQPSGRVVFSARRGA